MKRRAPTLLGVAPCAQAPSIRESRTGYSTTPYRRARTNTRTREAIRIDIVRIRKNTP